MKKLPWGKRCLLPVPFNHLHILPTIFDDSMSYYEVLNKLSFTINQMIKYLNSMVIKATYIEPTETLVFETDADDIISFSYKEDTETLVVRLDISRYGGDCCGLYINNKG